MTQRVRAPELIGYIHELPRWRMVRFDALAIRSFKPKKKPGSRAGLTGVRRISVKDRFTMRQDGIYQRDSGHAIN